MGRQRRRRRSSSRREPTQPKPRKPKSVVKKPKPAEEGLPLKKDTLEQQLWIASIGSLPNVDLHGDTRDEIEYKIKKLLSDNRGEFVRILYGAGTGVLGRAVMKYLQAHSRGKNKTVEGYRKDNRTHSVIVKVAD